MLGIRAEKVTQALDPALVKLARLWRVDPTRTMEAMLDAARNLDPMTDAELDLRERILMGCVDRSELQPPGSTEPAGRGFGPR